MLKRLPAAFPVPQIIQVASYTFESYISYHKFVIIWISRVERAVIQNLTGVSCQPPGRKEQDGQVGEGLREELEEAGLTKGFPRLPWFCSDSSSYWTGLQINAEEGEDYAGNWLAVYLWDLFSLPINL